MTELVEAKRARPGADVTSRLLVHPAGLTDDEVIRDLRVLLIAATSRPPTGSPTHCG